MNEGQKHSTPTAQIIWFICFDHEQAKESDFPALESCQIVSALMKPLIGLVQCSVLKDDRGDKKLLSNCLVQLIFFMN